MHCLDKLVRNFQRERLVAFLCSTPGLDCDTRASVWSCQKNKWHVSHDPLTITQRIRVIVETEHGMDWTEFEELVERYHDESPSIEEDIRLEAIENLYDLIEYHFCHEVLIAYIHCLCFHHMPDSQDEFTRRSMPQKSELEITAEQFAKYVNPDLYTKYMEASDIEYDSDGYELEDYESRTDILREIVSEYEYHPWGGVGRYEDLSTTPSCVYFFIDGTLSLLGYDRRGMSLKRIKMYLSKDEFLSAFRDVVTKVWLPEVIERLEEYRV
jgi:hypothetical protein